MNLEPNSPPRQIHSQDNKRSPPQGAAKAEKEEQVTLTGGLTPDQVNRNLPTSPMLHSSSSVISSQVAETLRNPFQEKREMVSEERRAEREKRRTTQEKRKAEHLEAESDSKGDRESHLRPKNVQLKIRVDAPNLAGGIQFSEDSWRDGLKLQAAAAIAALPEWVDDEDHPDYDADYALVPIWRAALTHIDAEFISHQRQAILALESTAKAPWGRNLLTNFYANLGMEGKLTAEIIATERAAIITSSRTYLSDSDKADVIEQLYGADSLTSTEVFVEFNSLAALRDDQISAAYLCEMMRYLIDRKIPGGIEKAIAEQLKPLIEALPVERFGAAMVARLLDHLDAATRVDLLD